MGGSGGDNDGDGPSDGCPDGGVIGALSVHCTASNSLVLGATVEQSVVPPSGPHHALVQTRRVEQVLALHPQILPGFFFYFLFIFFYLYLRNG